MALFGRKKDGVLPEVDKYYQAEKRDRTGLAWLLALVSIAVVAGVLVTLFLAGRWAYDRITQDDSQGTVATVDGTTNGTSFDGAPTTSDQPVSPTPSDAEGDQEVPAPATPQQESNSSSTQDAGSRPTAPSGQIELPRTGASNLFVTFSIVSLVAAAIHYSLQRRNTTS